MEIFASTTRTKRADHMAEMKEVVKAYTDDDQALLCIMPKKKAPTTLLVCVGKFIAEEGGTVLWMPHPKQAFFGNAEATANSLEELAGDGPTIPVLLSDLTSDMRQWVDENATNMHDWLALKPDHDLYNGFMKEYQRGGSLTSLEELLEEEEGQEEEGQEETKEEATAPTEDEPRRGRYSVHAKGQPLASRAATKPDREKAVPSEEAVTPARRSARLSKKAAETPSTAMARLLME
jgi:hypothetical protein